MAQVLQVEGPGSQLLPVHPLEGHDAVEVPAHLGPKGPIRSDEQGSGHNMLVQIKHRQR